MAVGVCVSLTGTQCSLVEIALGYKEAPWDPAQVTVTESSGPT